MTGSKDAAQTTKRHLAILQGVLPFDCARLPADILGGVTLAALGIPRWAMTAEPTYADLLRRSLGADHGVRSARPHSHGDQGGRRKARL